MIAATKTFLSSKLGGPIGHSTGVLGSAVSRASTALTLRAWFVLTMFVGAIGVAFGGQVHAPAPDAEPVQHARVRRFWRAVSGSTTIARGALNVLKTKIFRGARRLAEDSPEAQHLADLLEQKKFEYFEWARVYSDINKRSQAARALELRFQQDIEALHNAADENDVDVDVGEDGVSARSARATRRSEMLADIESQAERNRVELDDIHEDARRTLDVIDELGVGIANLESALRTARRTKRVKQAASSGRLLAIGAIMLITLSSLIRRVRAATPYDAPELTSNSELHSAVFSTCMVVITIMLGWALYAFLTSANTLQLAISKNDIRFSQVKDQVLKTGKELEKAAKPIGEVAEAASAALSWYAIAGASVVVYSLVSQLYKRLRATKPKEKEVAEAALISPAERQVLTAFDSIALLIAGYLFVKGGPSAGKNAWSAMRTVTSMMTTTCAGFKMFSGMVSHADDPHVQQHWVEDVAVVAEELEARSEERIEAAEAAAKAAADARAKAIAAGKPVAAEGKVAEEAKDEDSYMKAIKAVWADPADTVLVRKVKFFFRDHPEAKPFVLFALFVFTLVVARWAWTHRRNSMKMLLPEINEGNFFEMKSKPRGRGGNKNRQSKPVQQRAKMWITYDPATGEPIDCGFMDELGHVSAAIGRRARKTAADHLAQIHDQWGLHATSRELRDLVNEAYEKCADRVVVNGQDIDPKVIMNLSQYKFTPVTDAQLEDENFPIYRLPSGFVFVAPELYTDKVSESESDEEESASAPSAAPLKAEAKMKSAKAVKNHAKAVDKDSELLYCRYCLTRRTVAKGGHYARENDDVAGTPTCRGLIKKLALEEKATADAKKRVAESSKKPASAESASSPPKAPVVSESSSSSSKPPAVAGEVKEAILHNVPTFDVAKASKSMGWMIAVDGKGISRANLFCIALNGIITPRHTLGAEGDKKREVTFYFRDLVFTTDLKATLIGRDLLWWPMPKALGPLIANHTALNVPCARAPVAANAKVALVTFMSMEAAKLGALSVSTGSVIKVDLTPDAEDAHYTASSVMGNCGGVVLDSMSRCVGWHIGTRGDFNSFIPLHGGMTDRCKKPDLSVF